MPATVVATPSLRLRRFVAAEAPRVMALNAEPTTARWLPSHVYADADEAARTVGWLIRCCDDPGHPAAGPYVLAVEHAASGELLGHVGFSPLDAEVEVSYAIAERARGRGLGTEALAHACRWVRQRFGLTGIVAMTAAANAASRRTLHKAGFGHAGDTTRRFQGRVQAVSRYEWRPVASSDRHA